MRSLRALLSFAFALVMMIVTGGAAVQDGWLLCRMEKRVHRTCCCTKHEAKARGAVDEIARVPCCDVAPAVDAALPPSTSSVPSVAVVPPVLLEVRALPGTVALAAPDDAAATPRVEPRATAGPPLRIRLCSLLT